MLKISVVTPSYNQGPFIREAIESVLAQGYPAFEHIIVDNCSDDGTVELLKHYGHLRWISEPDRGQSHALNKGFGMATGEIIGWLNADDRYRRGCFAAVASHFRQTPGSDILYGDYTLINTNGDIVQKRRELEFDLFMLKYLHVLYIPSTATFFRRRIFEEGNFMDVAYHYAMDYEFFLRLAVRGYRFAHIPQFLADFRQHVASKSSMATRLQLREKSRALREYDPLLKRLSPPMQTVLEWGLMVGARFKRYCLKGVRGYYSGQWSKREVKRV